MSASIVEIEEWAFSAAKKPIALFKSENIPTRPIVLIGGVHGDEPEGVWLAEATLEWLKNTTPQLPWIIIPNLNPDGGANHERVNGNGVDLNRNYPSKSWSPKFDKPRYNPGPRPASEPEIQSLVELVVQTKPRLLIHCHSWLPCVVYAGPDELPAGQVLAEASGYPLKNDVGYPTPGSLSEWGWVDHKIPVVCIEECEGTMKKDVWPRFAGGIKKIFSSPEWWG